MSSIKLGSLGISNAKLGSTQVSQIYKGSSLIWSNATTTTTTAAPSTTTSTTTAAPTPVTDRLQIYYDISKTASYPGSGSTLYNLQQSSYNASLSNITYSSAQGGILEFNNGVTNSSADTSYSTNDSAYTVMYLVKYLATPSVSVTVGKYSGGGDDTWTGLYNNEFVYSVNGNRNQAGTGNPGTTNYYLFTVSTGAAGNKVYTNTTLNNTTTQITNSPGSNWIIGQFGTVGGVGSSFNLGSFLYYDRQLSDSEVTTNYNALFTRY